MTKLRRKLRKEVANGVKKILRAREFPRRNPPPPQNALKYLRGYRHWVDRVFLI